MKRLLERVEEFNLNREKRFRGKIENSILYLVHDLNSNELSSTITALKSITKFQDIIALQSQNLNSILGKEKNSVLLTLHLALDTELLEHNRISNWAFEHNFFQLNPYNKIAKIFDDKYLFYALMCANDIKQAFTVSWIKGTEALGSNDRTKLEGIKNFVIKPRNGTEKMDFLLVDNLDSETSLKHIAKIHQYDDALIQEAINFSSEFKVLYFQGDFYSSRNINGKLENLLFDFVELLEDYSSDNQIIMPEVFSVDILELNGGDDYLILEANIRPGAMYKQINPPC